MQYSPGNTPSVLPQKKGELFEYLCLIFGILAVAEVFLFFRFANIGLGGLSVEYAGTSKYIILYSVITAALSICAFVFGGIAIRKRGKKAPRSGKVILGIVFGVVAMVICLLAILLAPRMLEIFNRISENLEQ